MRKWIAAILLAITMVSLVGCNATRKGTNRYTICGSKDIYYNSGNYAYCYRHFQDMLDYSN